jgi:hypothetical protein
MTKSDLMINNPSARNIFSVTPSIAPHIDGSKKDPREEPCHESHDNPGAELLTFKWTEGPVDLDSPHQSYATAMLVTSSLPSIATLLHSLPSMLNLAAMLPPPRRH